MNHKDADSLRQSVRDSYGNIAEQSQQAGCCSGESCCGGGAGFSTALGYSSKQLLSLPEGADLGLGCGNPQAIASIKQGETVLDLGSGAGIDCFLAAQAVGSTGQVIGVDMTPAMISKARANAEKVAADNVQFRLGEIEYLPVADDCVDAIISNCVINLSPDKGQVFRDAFRVLKAGGRLAVSDIVATAELPQTMKNDLQLYSGCMAGASLIDELENLLGEAGFEDIRITPKDESRDFIRDWAPGLGIEDLVTSASITARKPAR